MSTLSKVLLVMVCLASLGFLWAAARALKTWSAYRDVYNQYVQRIDTVESDVQRLIYGDENEPSISELKAEQAVVYYDRGRVWTGCSPSNFDPQTGTIQVRTGFPDPPNLQQGTTVHVFEASDDPTLGNRRYVGEFAVTASAPPDPNGAAPNVTLDWIHKFTTASLTEQIARIKNLNTGTLSNAVAAGNLTQLANEVATLRNGIDANVQLTPEQKQTAKFELSQLAFMVREMQRVANSSAPWSLYQVMPNDSYARFAEIPKDELRNRFPAPDMNLMTPEEQQLRTAIRDMALQQYLNQGEAPGEEAPNEEVIVRVRFKKNFGDPGVDQQALAGIQILDFSNDPDEVRRANSTRLVTEGQEAWVSAEVVDELKNLGLVDEIERRYQRPLRDYTQIFNEFYRTSPVIDDKVRAILADRDQTNLAADLAEAYNIKLQQHRQVLTAERDLLTDEAKNVAAHVAELDSEVSEVQQQIAALEKLNQEWAAKLAEAQLDLQRRIEAASSAQASSQ